MRFRKPVLILLAVMIISFSLASCDGSEDSGGIEEFKRTHDAGMKLRYIANVDFSDDEDKEVYDADFSSVSSANPDAAITKAARFIL